MNAVRILLILAIASPILALWPSGQDPTAVDWAKDVERALTSPRYGLRLAAGKKVAAAGAAAVPAIREQVKKTPLNDPLLVDAIADANSAEPAVLDLLRGWASDRDFYWRSQAMRGLARRAAQLQAGRDELAAMFVAYHADPAWLMRTHARFGSVMLGDDGALGLPDPDPRSKARLTALLLAAGKLPPLQPLIDALAEERTFLSMPWGQQLANEAHKALKLWLGDQHPLAGGGAFADTATGLAAVTEAARTKSHQALVLPVLRVDPAPAAVGGIEILSCKNGDQFVQWSDAGEIWFGLDRASAIRLESTIWTALCKERTELSLQGDQGVVICDSMRLQWEAPPLHVKIAPESLPAPAHDWLKRFAQALEEAGEQRLAGDLRTGIEQFARR